MKDYSLLGFNVHLLENIEECNRVKHDCPSSISMMAFDTETDTVINMVKRDSSNIDILHDHPFLGQFGYGNTVYLGDFRNGKEFTKAFLDCFDEYCQKSNLCFAHNIKFDISMLMNVGYTFHTSNLCDSMSVARLALEAKSEREGGLPMSLKPLATALLGSEYSEAGHEVDDALKSIWQGHLKTLAIQLKPYGISRKQITDVLKDVAGTLDDFPEEVQEIWNDWTRRSEVRYSDVPKEILYRYGATDVILVLRLMQLLLPVVADRQQLNILKNEMALVMPLVRMERTGYAIDIEYIKSCKQKLIKELLGIKAVNKGILGEEISPNQHMAIKAALKRKFGYELQSTDKNKMQIAIDNDKAMPDAVKEYLSNVLYLRTLEKWIATYINPMLYKYEKTHDSVVCTQFNASGAVSGRFTSNFQQFPKNAILSKLGSHEELFHPRRMFIVGDKYAEMAYIDYSQVELRLQAEYTYYCTHGYGDVNMIRAYRPFKCHKDETGTWRHDEDNEKWEGVDIHTQSTKGGFPEVPVGTPKFKKLRYIGKKVNFAMIYGASLTKVQENMGDVDPEVVAKLYNGFHRQFKDVKTYQRWVTTQWVRNGGYVVNLMGRRYYMSESRDVYKLNNYLIQGSAADIIKTVIHRVDEMLLKGGYKTRLQGCIHDELCICVAEGEHDVIYKIKHIMEHTVKTFVPLVAEIEVTKTTWADKKEE